MMITEFTFTDSEIETFYAIDFPIDLKIGENIFIGDFLELFKKGNYYCPEDDFIENEKLNDLDAVEAYVNSVRYGMQNGILVKMVYLTER